MNSHIVSAVAAAVLMIAATACTNQAELGTLADEPLLEPPPGAVELLRTETAGSSFGFQSPARIEIVWGVPDHDAALAWYLDRHEEAYRLSRQGTDTRYLGGRQAGDHGVTVSVQTYPDASGVRWSSLIGEEADAAPWGGAVAVARVSTDG